jgi:hypothetical protein
MEQNELVSWDEIAGDPVMRRLAAVARTSPHAQAWLERWRRGVCSREDALVGCVESLAAYADEMMRHAVRLIETQGRPTVVRIGAKDETGGLTPDPRTGR